MIDALTKCHLEAWQRYRAAKGSQSPTEQTDERNPQNTTKNQEHAVNVLTFIIILLGIPINNKRFLINTMPTFKTLAKVLKGTSNCTGYATTAAVYACTTL